MKYVSAPRRRRGLVAAFSAALAAVGMTFLIGPAQATQPEAENVHVCHATGAGTYVDIHVSESALYGAQGGAAHFDNQGNPQHAGDFILIHPADPTARPPVEAHGLPSNYIAGTPVGTGTTCAGATALPVTFRSLSASKVRGNVVLRWKTASEIDTLGYNVYREVNGKKVKLNRRVISGKGVTGGSYAYRYRVPKGTKAPARFWLEVINLDGSRTWRSVRA